RPEELAAAPATAVVALAGPGCELQEHTRAAAAPQGVTLVRLEPCERARAAADRLAARADLDLPFEHRDPGVLFHLVLADRLAGAEHDEDSASTFVRVEHDRIARPLGSIEVEQVPVLHQQEAYPCPDTLQRCSCRSPSTAS